MRIFRIDAKVIAPVLLRHKQTGYEKKLYPMVLQQKICRKAKPKSETEKDSDKANESKTEATKSVSSKKPPSKTEKTEETNNWRCKRCQFKTISTGS